MHVCVKEVVGLGFGKVGCGLGVVAGGLGVAQSSLGQSVGLWPLGQSPYCTLSQFSIVHTIHNDFRNTIRDGGSTAL